MRYLLLVPAFLLAFLFMDKVFAHPGNTAADGCRYCWTNCESWGYTYGTRHCHNGGTTTPSSGTRYVTYSQCINELNACTRSKWSLSNNNDQLRRAWYKYEDKYKACKLTLDAAEFNPPQTSSNNIMEWTLGLGGIGAAVLAYFIGKSDGSA